MFASNDDMAAAVIAMARKYGLDVPTDLTVVGFDDTEIATTAWPALTTVRQPIAEMARTAVDAIIRATSENGLNPEGRTAAQSWTLDCTIVERDSSGPPPS